MLHLVSSKKNLVCYFPEGLEALRKACFVSPHLSVTAPSFRTIINASDMVGGLIYFSHDYRPYLACN